MTSLAWYAHSPGRSWIGSSIERVKEMSDATLVKFVQAVLVADAPDRATDVLQAATSSGRFAADQLARLRGETLDAHWRISIEPIVRAGRPLEAYVVARDTNRKLGLGDTDDRLDALRAKLLEEASARSLQATQAAAPFAIRFHAARAKRLDPAVVVPPVDISALTASIPRRPSIDVSAECDWLRPHMPAAAGVPARANLRVTCTTDQKQCGFGAVAGFIAYGKYDAQQRVEAATGRAIARAVLDALGLAAEPATFAPARDPPQTELG